jgi:protein TonB
MIGAHGDRPIAAAYAAEPPVVVSRVLPAYPALARSRGIEGQVLLRAIVDRDGRVEPRIDVIRSIAPLDDAAIEALRRWRFRPGRDRTGRPVRVIVEVPVRFQLR